MMDSRQPSGDNTQRSLQRRRKAATSEQWRAATWVSASLSRRASRSHTVTFSSRSTSLIFEPPPEVRLPAFGFCRQTASQVRSTERRGGFGLVLELLMLVEWLAVGRMNAQLAAR